ncbi:MAG: hypothetical protein AAGA08_19730 [Pseudomonadota bacterium]
MHKIIREEGEDARRVARDIAKTKRNAISIWLQKKVERHFCISIASSVWADCVCVAHAAQTTSFFSQHPTKISANWPRSFLHGCKRKKPDQNYPCARKLISTFYALNALLSRTKSKKAEGRCTV